MNHVNITQLHGRSQRQGSGVRDDHDIFEERVDSAIEFAMAHGCDDVGDIQKLSNSVYSDLISNLAALDPCGELHADHINTLSATIYRYDESERLERLLEAINDAQSDVYYDEAQRRLDAAWAATEDYRAHEMGCLDRLEKVRATA